MMNDDMTVGIQFLMQRDGRDGAALSLAVMTPRELEELGRAVQHTTFPGHSRRLQVVGTHKGGEMEPEPYVAPTWEDIIKQQESQTGHQKQDRQIDRRPHGSDPEPCAAPTWEDVMDIIRGSK